MPRWLGGSHECSGVDDADHDGAAVAASDADGRVGFLNEVL